MGQTAGPALSMASVGLSAYGEKHKAEGINAGYQFQANKLDRAAEYGRLRGTQTGTALTMQLNKTLGMIDTIRAAAHTDPSSPTGAAVRDRAEHLGTVQKTTRVNSILAQARQDEADAEYLRAAGKRALLAGKISMWSTILSGLSAGSPFGGGGGGGGGAGVSAGVKAFNSGAAIY